MTRKTIFLILVALIALVKSLRRFAGDVRVLQKKYRGSPYAPAYLRKTAVLNAVLFLYLIVSAVIEYLDPDFAYTHKPATLLLCALGGGALFLLLRENRKFVARHAETQQSSGPQKPI